LLTVVKYAVNNFKNTERLGLFQNVHWAETMGGTSGVAGGSCPSVPYALPPAAPSRREIIRALSTLLVHCCSV